MIKEYIEFAINNRVTYYWDFKITSFKLCNKVSPSKNIILRTEINDIWDSEDIIRFITSKPFIEAIARGVQKSLTKMEDYIIINHNMYEKRDFTRFSFEKTDLVDDITTEQAIYIRENKLEEFIIKIIWNELKK